MLDDCYNANPDSMAAALHTLAASKNLQSGDLVAFHAEAQRVLKDLLDGAQLGPAHYRRAQAEWLDRARRELS